MNITTIQAKITGVTPLIMHSGSGIDPLDEFSIAKSKITAKRTKKTEEDIQELYRLDFMSGLYLDGDNHPAIPGENIEAMIRDGAKATRNGKAAVAGVLSDGVWKLSYPGGPKTPDELWAKRGMWMDKRAVKVSTSRVIRVRPKFTEWSLNFQLVVNTGLVSASKVREWLETAGVAVGLGDFRPRFGRFVVDSWAVVG